MAVKPDDILEKLLELPWSLLDSYVIMIKDGQIVVLDGEIIEANMTEGIQGGIS